MSFRTTELVHELADQYKQSFDLDIKVRALRQAEAEGRPQLHGCGPSEETLVPLHCGL